MIMILTLAVALPGCGGGSQLSFPELHPVAGVVRKGGRPVCGGSIRFAPVPERPEFLVNAPVGPDGTFRLTTVRTTDTRGERKSGAAAGKYRVSYTPPAGAQTAGTPLTRPIDLPGPVVIEGRDNELTINLPGT
jgi:hypothetical protein